MPRRPRVALQRSVSRRRCGGRRRRSWRTRHRCPRTSRRATTRTCGRWASSPQLNRIARLPGELRARVQLHQRVDRARSATSASASASAARPDLLDLAHHHHRPVRSSPWSSPSWPATSRSPARSTSGRSACRTGRSAGSPGWFYFWAQVVTVTRRRRHRRASSSTGFTGGGQDVPRLARRRSASDDMFTFIAHHDADASRRSSTRSACGCWRSSTTSASRPRSSGCSSSRWSCCSSRTTSRRRPDRDVRGRGSAQNGNMLATFALGFFMSIFILYGFDTAGTFGEETIDASRQAPRGVLSSVLDLRRSSGSSSCSRSSCRIQDIPATMAEGLAGGFPIATTITGEPDRRDRRRDHGRRDLPLRHPGVGLRVHAGDPGRRDPDDVLDGPRPAPAARQPCWGQVNATLPDAGQRGRSRSASSRRSRSSGRADRRRSSLSIAATGLIYLSYFLCNLGVLAVAAGAAGRSQKAWFNLGRWGMLDQHPGARLRRR